jgi:single-strand DNA-binding protein
MPSKTTNSSPTVTSEKQSIRKSSRGASVNRVILTGRVVATPELRTTGSGLHVTTARIVTNDREQPEFHDVVLWRQMAAFATKHMVKGRLAYVKGRLQSRTWEAADGSKRRTLEVIGDRFQAPRARGPVWYPTGVRNSPRAARPSLTSTPALVPTSETSLVALACRGKTTTPACV